MSVAAFFGTVWSFLLTLVRALFSFRRRSVDPLVLPRVHRPPPDALARAHTRLRPILLTPRSITFAYRTTSTRTRSATSTLVPPTVQQRTSPKLDPELGQGTPNTSNTASLSVLPLTPPDRCYLALMPSPTDCPYAEPWPTILAGKPRHPGSPLKMSFETLPEPMVVPEHWSPVQIWTSTPCKDDPIVPDPALSPFDHKETSSALANISHALMSRSQKSAIQPYDDASPSSASSGASMFVNHTNERGPDSLCERHRTRAHAARFKNQPYLRFQHPDAYAWRRRGPRVPGKPDRATHAYTRSCSHLNSSSCEWYDADAYAPSPISALSPPRGDPPTDDEDEDEDDVPLGRLRDRIVRRSAAMGTIGLGVTGRAVIVSPRTRRMSDGCLLAISESTPTRVGVGARPRRRVLSLALDGDGPRDWLDALSLRFPPEQKEALHVV